MQAWTKVARPRFASQQLLTTRSHLAPCNVLARDISIPSPARRFSTEVSAADLSFGQPLHETHPHLLGPGELTPGISALEYAQRRSSLASRLPPGSIAVLAASDLKYRSGAAFYEFHQDSNFFYLTGFDEPEALAVIAPNGITDDHLFYLYVRPKDRKAEMWEGARSGVDAAMDVFNADEAGEIGDITTVLPKVFSAASEIYTDIPIGPSPSSSSSSSLLSRLFGASSTQIQATSRGLADLVGSKRVKPLKGLVSGLRVFKSDAEIDLMRRTGRATGRSFCQAMRRKWTLERDLRDFIEYGFKRHGCHASAYVPVVAGGKNALSIHYTQNNSSLRQGDLVLVDAGGEIGHYVSDVTRTFPVSARFSTAQRDLYNAVLEVQRHCISLCRANAKFSLDRLHETAEEKLKHNLRNLGFDVSGKKLDVLFPHHLGHYIGLEVHDSPGYPRTVALRESQCITIEPSIHVPDDDRWPAHFRGLSIQIEDSVAIGAEHPVVLSSEAVKEVIDIEALRGQQIENENSGRV